MFVFEDFVIGCDEVLLIKEVDHRTSGAVGNKKVGQYAVDPIITSRGSIWKMEMRTEVWQYWEIPLRGTRINRQWS